MTTEFRAQCVTTKNLTRDSHAPSEKSVTVDGAVGLNAATLRPSRFSGWRY
jgi:hypothetical protein